MIEEKELEINSWINDLEIRNDLKQSLISFNMKINLIRKNGINTSLDVVIDQRSKREIEILVEYTTKILEEYELYKDVIKYRNYSDEENIRNGIIVIDDFDIFYDKIIDSFNFNRRFTNFIHTVRNNNNMVIYTCSNKIDDNLKNISKNIFDPALCIHIEGINEHEQYNELLERYNNSNIKYKLSYKTFLKILKELEDKEYNKNYNSSLVDYLYNYSVKKMILNDSKIINEKIFDEFIKTTNKIDINSLVGLNNVKKELDGLYSYLHFAKKMKINDNIYLNLFFLGNPGTGKTTVARMYADKLYEMNYIKENKIIEVVPNDLIGSFVGHTKNTIRKILDKAKGGILFIDEAYLLYSDSYSRGKNPYMEEAIVELIKYLENPENIVIFAGYTDEMKKIYNANPGIKSRIYKEIYFNDYKNEELYEILSNNIKAKGLSIDYNSKYNIMSYINNMKKSKHFGNARSMIGLSQKMIMNHVIKDHNNLIINENDLPALEINEKRMGFDTYD